MTKKKEVDKYKLAIENLKNQREQYLNEATKNQTLAVKAEGALEVLLQLEKESEDDTKSTD
jgi:hypothetical protein